MPVMYRIADSSRLGHFIASLVILPHCRLSKASGVSAGEMPTTPHAVTAFCGLAFVPATTPEPLLFGVLCGVLRTAAIVFISIIFFPAQRAFFLGPFYCASFSTPLLFLFTLDIPFSGLFDNAAAA